MPRLGGKPKGYKAPKTLEKEAGRLAVRQMVMASLKPMVQAQIANSIGIGHLFTRDKHGKFSRVENQAQIEELLKTGTEDRDYFIFAKDPSVQAFTDLLNRALDKPKEQPQDLNVTVTESLDRKVGLARERVAARKAKPE